MHEMNWQFASVVIKQRVNFAVVGRIEKKSKVKSINLTLVCT